MSPDSRTEISPVLFTQSRFDQDVYLRTGLSPICHTDREDIFVVGYPKSGNTWMQNLVASIVFGIDPRLAPDRLIQSLVPDVHYRLYYRRYRTPMFFKSHHLPRPDYRRVVYLVRDGRDTMVSYFHFLGVVSKSEPDFFKIVATGEGLFPCRWHEHIDAWLKNPYGAKLMTMSYESLKSDTVGKLQELCAFAELERPRDFLESTARACSFVAMREKEKKFGWDSPKWPRDKQFLRRGEIGSFRDEMPLDVSAEFIRQAGPTLARLGYPLG